MFSNPPILQICPHVTDTRTFVASWSEKGKVHIWDIAPQLTALETEQESRDVIKIKPFYTFGGHVVSTIVYLEYTSSVTLSMMIAHIRSLGGMRIVKCK